MFLLTAFTVVATIILAYILVSLIKASEAKLAEENLLLQVEHVRWGPANNNIEELINIDEGLV